jgi:2-polyprenyl-3-methyl-5-hydroxy-6-metoxy-1,4-benzoquinol methylase
MMPNSPTIVDAQLNQAYRDLAKQQGHDPDSLWVGGYVDYEWTHGRYFLEQFADHINAKHVLEFGCNHGATSIVLALLGARVTAIDIDADVIKLAQANAARHGVADKIDFIHCTDTSQLPFDDQQFDAITCNSVLEYVEHDNLLAVEQEIDRTLKKSGLVLIYSTSNRLWPREVHSGRWLVNYLPRWLDQWISPGNPLQRGVFPSELLAGFRQGYHLLDKQDNGASYLEVKRKMGTSTTKLKILKLVNTLTSSIGLPVGMLAPSLTIVLQKNQS